jgi:hypothetical protein
MLEDLIGYVPPNKKLIYALVMFGSDVLNDVKIVKCFRDRGKAVEKLKALERFIAMHQKYLTIVPVEFEE